MLRRIVPRISAPVALTHTCSFRYLAVDAQTRDSLTKHLASLKEECKGQGLDLADMCDSAKAAARGFQDCVKKSSVDDSQFKGKVATLSASVKAYHTRLSNLQNESRSIQAEADALLKILWGTERPQSASFSTPPFEAPRPAAAAKSEGDDFAVEPPSSSASGAGAAKGTPQVERVEGERVESGSASADGREVEASEIEVESIEVEVEPETAVPESPADTMKITDITKDLYERGVNFSDCLDARSLRQRYRDVLDGKILTGAQTVQKAKGPTTSALPNQDQPRMPKKPSYVSHEQHQQYQQPPPNTSDTGLAYDPYPNAQRKMVDPMKFVWEIKQEISVEKGVDPSGVDLWSGKVKLEDHKRLYDYPSVQNYPIEVRQKGDIPQ